MRLANILSTLLVAGPLAVAASATLGFALECSMPNGAFKTSSDFESDFDAIKSKSGSTLVRTYTSDQGNCAEAVLAAAKSKGFKVLLGAWPKTGMSPDAAMKTELDALKTAVPGNDDVVFGITVGSETMYRGDFPVETLLSMIQLVENAFPGVLVGTADAWNGFANGTGDPLIKAGVKLILANAFSYWQRQEIGNATASYFDSIMQAVGRIQQVSGSVDSVKIMNGETGWPTDGGTNYGPAIASTDHAATYWKSGVCGMRDWGVEVFYFEAFDAPQKGSATGQDGSVGDETHWGAFTVDRTAKFNLNC